MTKSDLSEYFSRNYAEARGRFFKLSHKGNGIRHTAYTHPLTGPANGSLTTDIAWSGPENARNVLIISSGLHGIEGFAGSAIQNRALSQDFLSGLPPETAVVCVHALNPHGFAWQRRVNEDNIDLNRNFIDWTKPPPADHPLNAKIQDLLTRGDQWRWPLLSVGGLLLCHGQRELQTALQQGQYGRPDGIFYGGAKVAWSNAVWQDILRRWTAQAEHVAHVDIHTGLGPFGYGEVITDDAPGQPGALRARQWFGDIRSTADGSSVSAEVSGSIHNAFNAAAQNREITSVTLEFGTLSPIRVLKALAFDNWVHARGKQYAYGEQAAAKMREAFAPSDKTWQRKVVRRGEEVLQQAKAGLIHSL